MAALHRYLGASSGIRDDGHALATGVKLKLTLGL